MKRCRKLIERSRRTEFRESLWKNTSEWTLTLLISAEWKCQRLRAEWTQNCTVTNVSDPNGNVFGRVDVHSGSLCPMEIQPKQGEEPSRSPLGDGVWLNLCSVPLKNNEMHMQWVLLCLWPVCVTHWYRPADWNAAKSMYVVDAHACTCHIAMHACHCELWPSVSQYAY